MLEFSNFNLHWFGSKQDDDHVLRLMKKLSCLFGNTASLYHGIYEELTYLSLEIKYTGDSGRNKI